MQELDLPFSWAFFSFFFYFSLFWLSHGQQCVFYKLRGGGQPHFDLYTDLVFPSRKSMIQLSLWTTKTNPCATSVHKGAATRCMHRHAFVLLKICTCHMSTHNILSPTMQMHTHTHRQTFLKWEGEEVGKTHLEAQHSIHHSKVYNKKDNNKTIG